MTPTGRLSGLLQPVFSLRSAADVGVGDFGALDAFFKYLRYAEQRMLMLLPLLPTAPGDSSPYSTCSAFGLNPLFIHLAWLPEGVSFTDAEKKAIEEAKASPTVRYDLVGPVKSAALERAFATFEHQGPSARSREFEEWTLSQRGWIEGFALYQAISEAFTRKPWWEWPKGLASREPVALDVARHEHKRAHPLPHLAPVGSRSRSGTRCEHKPSREASRCAATSPSSSAWTRLTAGAGPSTSAATPSWACRPTTSRPRAKTGASRGSTSRRSRRRETGGSKRAPGRPRRRTTCAASTTPSATSASTSVTRSPRGAVSFQPTRSTQQARGEQNFRMLSEGASIVAEDLGVIPRFARDTLARLKLPGYHVMRWSREDGVYRDPRHYAEISLVTTGTHDTETLRTWWLNADPWEREAVCRTWPELKRFVSPPPFGPELHEALLRAALNAQSGWCVLPWQDVFAETERVNTPGTVGPQNWTYRMRVDVEELLTREETVRVADWLARLTREARRSPSQPAAVSPPPMEEAPLRRIV